MGLFRAFIKRNIHLRRLIREWRLRTKYPDWKKIFDSDFSQWEEVLGAKKKSKILIATSVGAHIPSAILESVLTIALTLRKAQVHVLLCDGVLPACQDCTFGITMTDSELVNDKHYKKLCASCFKYAYKMFASLGVKIHRYSDFLTDEDFITVSKIANETDIDSISDYQYKGIKVGEHAVSGALRFFLRGELKNELFAEDIVKRFFKSSLLTVLVTTRILEKENFDSAVFHHGIYVPQGVIGEVCRSKNVRVINWSIAYRKSSFIFSHNDTYHHTLMTESTKKWDAIELSDKLENTLTKYLKSRWWGTNDWIWFQEKPKTNKQLIESKFGVDFSKPCIGLLTNVVWDAQLHYPANAFPDMLTWLIDTIRYFEKRPELQLLIRVHPAEVLSGNPSRQKIIEELDGIFPALPKNVFVIPPDDSMSTYVAMMQCDSVLIYGTKTGLELTSLGIPVIVVGEAWIRNKGVTMDANSPEEYFKLLEKLPLNKRLDEKTIKRARKYAYHFFFRRMIPMPFMKPLKGWPLFEVDVSGLSDFKHGQHKGLDLICSGIMEGADFIYEHESV